MTMNLKLKTARKSSSMLLIGGVKTGRSEIVYRNCKTKHTAYITTYCLFKDSQRPYRVRHKPSCWDVYEESIYLASYMLAITERYDAIVLDNIPAWIANLVTLKLNVYNEIDQLVSALKRTPKWIAITSEASVCSSTGSLWALYTRVLSGANQQLALAAGRVYVSMAGLVLRLK